MSATDGPTPANEGPPGRVRDAAESCAGEELSATAGLRESGMRSLAPAAELPGFGIGRDGYIYNGPVYIGDRRRRSPLVGAVPADLLADRLAVYRPGPGHDTAAGALATDHLAALYGPPGTGRFSAALSLLHAVASRVRRLDPDDDLAELDADTLEEGCGYLAQPAGPVTEARLDRLGALLSERGAYAVVITTAPIGRHGVRCEPPPETAVLASHLDALLLPTGSVAQLVAAAGGTRVRAALGLDELRPREARWLAGLLALHRGEADQTDLLAECRTLAYAQVREWFGPYPDSTAALRLAAYRIALAAFNGAPESVVAEAAELLAYELVRTWEPGGVPGRPVFGEDPDARLLAARAELKPGVEEPAGRAPVAVREVWFRGAALAPAVLAHVWTRYHNARRPLVAWLRRLVADPRPLVWVRAALAGGLLVGLDPGYGLPALIQPMAASGQVRQRMFAALALDQAARSGAVAAALREQVLSWGRDPRAELRWTAAAVHSYGTVAGSTGTALDEIARIGSTEHRDLYAMAGYAAVQLLGRPDPDTVLDRLAAWLDDTQPHRTELALLTIARLAASTTDTLPEPPGPSGSGGRPATDRPHGRGPDRPGDPPGDRASVWWRAGAWPGWPVAVALAAARAGWGERVATLLWRGLHDQRSQEAVLAGVTGWVRHAAGDAELLAAVASLLPSLVRGAYDGELLNGLLARLLDDPDDPVPARTVRDLRRALTIHTRGEISASPRRGNEL